MTTLHAVFSWLGNFVVRRRFICMACVLVITALLANHATGLRFDGSVDVWFVDGDPAAERRNDFHRAFGNHQSVLIVMEQEGSTDIFSPASIASIRKLIIELQKSVPYLKEVLWVGSMDMVEPDGDGIRIVRLFEHEPPYTVEETEAARQKALAEPDFVHRYISQDGKALALLIELQEFPTDAPAPEKNIALAVYDSIEHADLAGVKFSVVGEPAFMYGYESIAAEQTPRLFALCLLLQLILLAFLTRTFAASFTPLLIVLTSVVWTFGFIGLAGYNLNLMIIGLPIILVCVCTGDAVHLITAFTQNFRSGLARKDAMRQAVADVGWPCLLTTLTTAAGFFSFIAAPMRPFQEMAIYISGGVIAALVLTFVMVPFFFTFGRDKYSVKTGKTNSDTPQRDRLDIFLEWLSTLVIRSPLAITICFLLLSLAAAAGALFVRIESNNNRLLTAEVPLRQAIDRVDSVMGGSMAVDVMLNTGRENGVKSADFLKAMEKMEQFMASHPLVVNTASVLEPLRKTRAAVYGGDPSMRSMPETDRAAAEYLFLYEMAGGNQLDRLLSFDSSQARINARTASLGTEEGRILSEDIRKAAHKFLPPDIQVAMSGSIDLTVALTDNVAQGQNSSFAMAFVVIFLLMMLATRSVRMGLISMAPNVVPVLMVLGFLGVSGIYMDTILMSVSAMILGVATDDTIHFYVRLRREFEACGKYEEAVRATLTGVGRPLIYTTATLALGFAVLTLSVMVGWVKIGFFAGYAFCWALAADLLLSPALVLLIRPFGKERVSQKEI